MQNIITLASYWWHNCTQGVYSYQKYSTTHNLTTVRKQLGHLTIADCALLKGSR